MPYNVLLVDDHKLMRDGVKTILEGVADFKVMAEAENGTDAVQACKKLRPDIVLMDIGLPGMNGIEATEEILRCEQLQRVVGGFKKSVGNFNIGLLGVPHLLP